MNPEKKSEDTGKMNTVSDHPIVHETTPGARYNVNLSLSGGTVKFYRGKGRRRMVLISATCEHTKKGAKWKRCGVAVSERGRSAGEIRKKKNLPKQETKRTGSFSSATYKTKGKGHRRKAKAHQNRRLKKER